MTVRPAPGSPKLVIDGEEEQPGPLSDSEFEGLAEDDQVQENLGRIARAKGKPNAGR